MGPERTNRYIPANRLPSTVQVCAAFTLSPFSSSFYRLTSRQKPSAAKLFRKPENPIARRPAICLLHSMGRRCLTNNTRTLALMRGDFGMLE